MEELLSWLSLKTVRGIGNVLFKRLIDRFQTPETVFQASDEELFQVEGITSFVVASIRQHRPPDWIKKDLEIVREKGYRMLTLASADYPSLLLQIPDPPPVLYVYGTPKFPIQSVAVVGSRTPTRYGILTSKRLSFELAQLEFTIVSGMARGIDTAAHIGALSGGGATVAVLGSGLERVYPYENRELFHKIAEHGAVISEFPLMAGPEPHHFPVRNRIISGISLGTVVVEAAQKSGSLITARLAAEQNREVFAVPGNIHSFKSIGTHNLIKQGAKLVENAQDVVEELVGTLTPKPGTGNVKPHRQPELPAMSPEESLVVTALGPYPIHIDDLIRKLSMEPGKVSSILLQLELKGIVQQSPGKMFTAEG